MLSGGDISEFQGQIDWPTFSKNVNFAIIKATEGNGYIDQWFGNNRQQARNTNTPRGFYHFARPDLGNDPVTEAGFFISYIKGGQLLTGESLYLDYEVQWNGDNVNWVLTWMQQVEQQLGIKPIFYTYQSMLSQYDWTPVVNNGNALWIAAPGTDPTNANPTFQTGAWPNTSFCQWGQQTIPGVSGQVDSDVFYGDLNGFLSFGLKPPPPPPPPPDPCASIKQQLSTLQSEYDAYKLSHPTLVVTTDHPIVTTTIPSTPVVTVSGTQAPVTPPPSNWDKFMKWLSSDW